MIEKIKYTKLGRSVLLRCTFILSFLNKIIPKKHNRILFYESSKEYLDDNSEAVLNYLVKNGYESKYDIVCCIPNKKSAYYNQPVKIVGAVKGVLLYLTSKYVFFSFGDFRITPSSSQKVINLWHGTPAKKIGKLTYDKNYQNEKLDNFSYILSSSENVTKIMAKAFGCDENKVVVLGHPRIDYLFSSNNTLSEFGVSYRDYKKTIIWMPTFRKHKGARFNDGNIEKTETMLPVLNTFSSLEKINEVLIENELLLVIKIHPGAAEYINVDFSNIKLINNEDLNKKGIKLYEFVKDFDALITDYSSIYFDWLVLDRPIGFTLDDYELYENSRGFVFENMKQFFPGKHIYSYEDFYEYILDVANNIDNFSQERENVKKIFCKYSDGENCKRLLDYFGIN